MLKSETNTQIIENEIVIAAKENFKGWKIEDNKMQIIFEHGQWWIRFFDEIEEIERTFSVVDAEGYGVVNGFDFEEV